MNLNFSNSGLCTF